MIKTPEGKWILFDSKTGEQGEFWPIDGKELLQQGSHTAEPPDGSAVVLPPAPPKHAGVPQAAPVQTFAVADGDATRPSAQRKKE